MSKKSHKQGIEDLQFDFREVDRSEEMILLEITGTVNISNIDELYGILREYLVNDSPLKQIKLDLSKVITTDSSIAALIIQHRETMKKRMGQNR